MAYTTFLPNHSVHTSRHLPWSLLLHYFCAMMRVYNCCTSGVTYYSWSTNNSFVSEHNVHLSRRLTWSLLLHYLCAMMRVYNCCASGVTYYSWPTNRSCQNMTSNVHGSYRGAYCCTTSLRWCVFINAVLVVSLTTHDLQATLSCQIMTSNVHVTFLGAYCVPLLYVDVCL